MARASLSCEMPSAERWRSPSDLGMSVSCDTGRMQPAAVMRFCEIIMAPSCSGEFLKKMFSMSRWLTSAFNRSPVLMISSSGTERCMTMSAPVFAFPMLIHAMTIGMSAEWSASFRW